MNRPFEGGHAPTAPIVNLVAKKLVGRGQAIAHHEGGTWMVAGALPGEHIRAELTRRRAGIIEARTVEVVSQRHPARLEDPCPLTGVCGGCDWPHVDPAAGTELKAVAAAEAARGFPDLADRLASAPVHGSEYNYRLRARLHWDATRHILGFYEHRSRTVVSIAPCRILSARLVRALPDLEAALADRCDANVDLEWLEGSAPGDAVAALRPGKGGPQTVDAAALPDPNGIDHVVAGFHRLSAAGQLAPGWGATQVRVDLPVPLEVPIGAFFQGNRYLIGPLFERVGELVGSDTTPVFDLHAGVGYLAAAARHAGDRTLTLVEPHRGAALAAQRNLPGATVMVGTTAETFLARARKLPSDAIVITDPPRTGLSKNLRLHLARWRPRKILMLGCDPATWARDAGFLIDRGYRPGIVEILDLFPSTHHLEILASLDRV